jgi:hypothetical protein
MAYTLVSHVHIPGGLHGGTSSPISTLLANLIVLTLTYVTNGVLFPTVTDNQGNVYILGVDTTASATQNGKQLYYCFNPITSASHTFSNASSGTILSVGEVTAWTGPVPNAIGQTNHALNIGSPQQSGSATSTLANSLFIAAMTTQTAGTISIDSGFTITDQEPEVGGTNYAGAQAYLLQATAGTFNPQWTGGASTGASLIAVFNQGGLSSLSSNFFFGA